MTTSLIDSLLSLLKGPSEDVELFQQDEISSSIAKAKSLELKMQRSVSTDLLGEYSSAFYGQGLSFAELRDYQPGDDPRLIHWNSTARAGKPYIKVFHEERQLKVIILLDTSRSMLVDGRYPRAIEFASLLLTASKMNRDKVGVGKFSDTLYDFIPPSSSRAHYRKTLHSLLKAPKAKKSTDLSNVLLDLKPLLSNNSAVFILSDFESPTFSDELKLLTHSHLVTCIHFPGSIDELRNVKGAIQMKSAEGNEKEVVDLKSEEELKKFKRENTSLWERLKNTIEENGAAALQFEKSGPYTLRKLAQLKRRRRR